MQRRGKRMLLKQKRLLILQAASSLLKLRGAEGAGSVLPRPLMRPSKCQARCWWRESHPCPSASCARLDVRVGMESGCIFPLRSLLITVILSMRAVELGIKHTLAVLPQGRWHSELEARLGYIARSPPQK